MKISGVIAVRSLNAPYVRVGAAPRECCPLLRVPWD
jgi:hypothetical protein